jgi:uncharacterized membrane protein YbhN (UPF0104 family)
MSGAMGRTSQSGHADAPSSSRRGITARPWWPWAKRLVTLIFFTGVAYLLVNQARTVEWDEVLTTMRKRSAADLTMAVMLAAASFALYSSFDLLGRHYTGHRLRKFRVWTVNFISYAFNLNLGSLVGGVAFRFRLYSRLGLQADVITRVMFFSMLTNWLGYMLLGGLIFLLSPPSPPPDWKLDTMGLRALGAGMVCVAIAYMMLCAFSRRRDWTIRGHTLALPAFRLACLQLAMSTANWMIMGGIVYVLLDQKIDYATVLAVLLIAAIAGVITHVPAGLGVLEAVFVTLLAHEMPRSELLAALLTYRAIYYLAPLAIATLVYLLVETRAKKENAPR